MFPELRTTFSKPVIGHHCLGNETPGNKQQRQPPIGGSQHQVRENTSTRTRLLEAKVPVLVLPPPSCVTWTNHFLSLTTLVPRLCRRTWILLLSCPPPASTGVYLERNLPSAPCFTLRRPDALKAGESWRQDRSWQSGAFGEIYCGCLAGERGGERWRMAQQDQKDNVISGICWKIINIYICKIFRTCMKINQKKDARVD